MDPDAVPEEASEAAQSQRATGSDRRSEAGPGHAGEHSVEAPPPLTTVSLYAEDLAAVDYPRADPPEGPQLLRWDFSCRRTIVYDYVHREAVLPLGGNSDATPKRETRGRLHVDSAGNGTATVAIAGDLGTTEEGLADTIQGAITEDSIWIGHDYRVGYALREFVETIFFALPRDRAEVDVGHVSKWHPNVTVVGMVDITEPGNATLELAGYSVVDGAVCADLNARFDLKASGSRRHAQSDMTMDPQMVISEEGHCYFDVADRCFEHVAVAKVTCMRMLGDGRVLGGSEVHSYLELRRVRDDSGGGSEVEGDAEEPMPAADAAGSTGADPEPRSRDASEK